MNRVTIATLLLVTATLFTGCARMAVNTRIPPLAYIDSVSSSEVYVGEVIKFSGHAISSAGQIVTYNWRSNVNGDLSKLATFETNSLTAGPHTIWFKAQDSYGNWSQEVGTNVNVLTQGGPSKMFIKAFSASPPGIKEGDWTTLSWDVSGVGSVNITPGVGDVAPMGNRSVQPLQTTMYTIVATNEQGSTKATTEVSVTPTPSYSLILYSIAAEDGTIRNEGVTFEEVYVGQDQMQKPMKAFLSFDISSVPPNAVIKSAQLDLTKSNIINSPFPWQGSLLMYNQSYGYRLDASNNMVYLQNTPIFSWSYGFAATQMPDSYFTSPDMVKTVQTLVDLRSNRFKIQMQFEKSYYYPSPYYSSSKYQFYSKDANYIDIGSGTPRLIINYTLPQ